MLVCNALRSSTQCTILAALVFILPSEAAHHPVVHYVGQRRVVVLGGYGGLEDQSWKLHQTYQPFAHYVPRGTKVESSAKSGPSPPFQDAAVAAYIADIRASRSILGVSMTRTRTKQTLASPAIAESGFPKTGDRISKSIPAKSPKQTTNAEIAREFGASLLPR